MKKDKVTIYDVIGIAIQRPTRAITILGSLFLGYWAFPKAVVLIFAGWFVYRILYVLRRYIYGLGRARFFFLGTIALIPLFLLIFFEYNPNLAATKIIKPNLTAYFLKDVYRQSVNSWVIAHADALFRWKIGLIFSLLYGVVLYFINVELDNPTLKKNDLAGLQITEETLNSYNDNYYVFFIALSVTAMLLYSMPLAVLSFLYIIFTESFLTNKTIKLVDLAACLLVAFMASFWFDLNQFLSTFAHYKSVFAENGFMSLISREMLDYHKFMGNGVIIAGALAVKSMFNFSGTPSAAAEWQETKTQAEQVSIQDGVWFGHNTNKQPVIVADKELNQHCLLLGSTGSGKTTTIFTVVDSALERGLPLIFLDGKGSKELPQKLQALCQKHGRTLRVFALDGEEIPALNAYNPFASGNFTQWKNRIMSLFAEVSGRGQEHFALAEETYLNLLCQTLYKTGVEIDLKVLLAFLSHPGELIKLAREHDEFLAQRIEQAVEKNKDMSLDIVSQLELFFHSHYGGLFDTEGKPTIKVKEAIKNGECVLFMFNASSYAIDTKRLAKMVINDINSSFAELANEQGFTKTYCIFDEFASYASSNLADTISLHRSNGMHAIIGTQSITTVSLKSEETKRIAQELIACCNTFIVQAIGHLEDIELLAKTMGTRKTYEVTTQINAQEGGSTGLGSVRHVDEFTVNPQAIRELGTGEGFIYRKASKIKPYKIKFRLVI